MSLQIKYTKHAREKMVERGISEEEEVRRGIAQGAKHLQDPDKICSDYQYFVVVYKKIADICYVITVKPRW